MTTAPQRTISPTAWALMGMLALIWGGSFAGNRIALTEIGVLTLVALRVTGAAAALWVWVLVRRLPVPCGRRWLGIFALMGLGNNIIPFTLIVWGQSHIPSGLAGILNAATAIFTVLLVTLVFADERLTRGKAAGVAIGFAGVVVTVGPAALRALDLTSLGQLAVLGAALSYAVSAAYARHVMHGIRAEVAAAGMLTAAALVMLPLAVAAEGVPTFDWTPATWGALAYLCFAASALAYILYYAVMRLAGAGNVSLVTLMVAPVAIALGAVIFGETLAPSAYFGFALLTFGLLVIDGRILARFFA